MKKLVLLLIIAGASSQLCFSQMLNIVNSADGKVLKEQEFIDVKGSAYLYDEWLTGSAIDATGRPYPNLSLRYNIYKDVLEAKDKELMIALEPKLYKQFTIIKNADEESEKATRTFSNGFTQIPGIARENYLEVLYDGKYKFLKRHKIDLLEDKGTGYGSTGTVKSFSGQTFYYLINREGKAVSMGKLNKKNFIDALGTDGPKVEEYLNKEKVKLKTDNAYTIMLTYLEGL